MAERDLVLRVAASTGLPMTEAARVVDDVIAYYREPVEDYVRRRHAELQVHGRRNPEIFRILAEEVPERVFAGPEVSERQLRRTVYG